MKIGIRRILPLFAAALAAAVLVPALAWAGSGLREDPVGEVSGVSIKAEGGETVVSVDVSSGVTARHFLLENPTRLVLDLQDARHQLPRHTYDGIGRGGVVGLTSSQFESDVVRLVFELTSAPDYRVLEEGGTVEVRFSNPGPSFEPWSAAGRTESAGQKRAAPPEEPAGSGRGDDGDSSAGPSMDLQGTQPRISVSYDSASMLDVLAGFSEFSGMSIVPGDEVADMTVRGVSISDQPWDVALKAILSAHGLGWRQSAPGIIVVNDVEDLAARDTLETETRVLRINYASADSVAAMLRKLATPDRGQVVSYGEANSVIVTDRPPVVSRMDSLVGALDQRIPQVSIEAKIVFVDRTNVNSLGIVYDLKDLSQQTSFTDLIPTEGIEPGQQQQGQDGGQGQQQRRFPYTIDFGGPSLASLANANDRIANPSLQILASTVFGGFSLTSFLEALRSQQLSDVEAAPSIQVLDNHSAYVQVGERTPIRVLETGAQIQQAQVNVQFQDTGIILEVTPHVTNNNQVLLDLKAERSGLQVGLSDVGFNFSRQVGETRLLLDDGETGAIAGLTLTEVSRSESGIPLLMDLPLIGGLFRTTRNNERKQDLIILVTPHIVEPGLSGAAPSS